MVVYWVESKVSKTVWVPVEMMAGGTVDGMADL